MPQQQNTKQPIQNALQTGYTAFVRPSTENPAEHELSLKVTGIHCANCIRKIEGTLNDDTQTTHARLNFTPGRLAIRWQGSPQKADQYAQTIENLGFGVHPFREQLADNADTAENRFLLLCLGVAGFAAGNIMLLSLGLWITDANSMGMATREFLHWVSALIAIPAIVFSGRPFFRSAWSVLKKGHTNMDVPISLALTLATGMSLFETLTQGEHVYFDSAVMLMFFLLVGRYLDFRAKRQARSAANALASALKGFAQVLGNGQTKTLPIEQVTPGMMVLVAAGEKISVDGEVIEGQSSLDTSLITGETMPTAAAKGQHVFAGTLNLDAPLKIKATALAENTLLADIIKLMEQAEQGHAKYVRLAERAAKLYTPVVHSLALAAFVLWWLVLGAAWQQAMLIAVTVLIITCPCALGLAIPVVQVLASSVLMRKGVYLKSGDALERLASIDAAYFDKTGTLTLGIPSLHGTVDATHHQYAASLAAHSHHPLAKALASSYSGKLLKTTDVKEHAGKGLEGKVNGKKVRLGRDTWCGYQDEPTEALAHVGLSISGKPVPRFYFADDLKADAAKTIEVLHKRGIKTMLLSGDKAAVVNTVAHDAGIEEAKAELTPIEKHDVLEKAQASGYRVLMVGDGLNDAAVMAAANVSMAPSTALEITQNTADIVFTGNRLQPVAHTHRIAQRAQALVKQNFGLAICYNFIAVPLAFMGFVTPMVAAIAMSLSSLCVILNAFRLKFNA
ncbi:MAG: heavy metal translocating P-type ATPase [Magnetococcales bacterium]|nr:heavy metal translocating P-type ATPase [Magnetococcales bacterium]